MMRTYKDKPIEQKEPIRKEIEELTKKFIEDGGEIEKHKIYIRPTDVNIRHLPNWERETVKSTHKKATELGQKIIKLWNQGLSAKEIAESLGCNKNTIYRHVKVREIQECLANK